MNLESIELHRRGPGDTELARRTFAVMTEAFDEPLIELRPAYVGRLLDNPDFWVFTAHVGGEVVGGLTAHTLAMTRDESSEVFIYDLAVLDWQWANGSSLALRHAGAQAGIDVVFVPVDDDDADARGDRVLPRLGRRRVRGSILRLGRHPPLTPELDPSGRDLTAHPPAAPVRFRAYSWGTNSEHSAFRMGRLDHVHIRVPDRAEAARWYAMNLGFEPVAAYGFWATGFEGGPLQISADGGNTTLALFEASERHPMVPQRTGVAFSVDADSFMFFARSLPGGIDSPQGERLQLADLVDFDLCWAFDLVDPWGNQYELNCYDYARVKVELVVADDLEPVRYWPREAYSGYLEFKA